MESKYILIGTGSALALSGLAAIIGNNACKTKDDLDPDFCEGNSVPIVPYENKKGEVSNRPYINMEE